ncbi:type II toxin-antitoxin system VapC family toxin [Psychrobacter sp. 72-O-c]|uniref:type II toxin-antitoxin system VapC family toxin n=1 Tax=Psychrobacter sp. 72-O-c TaxID=2774125 RepID=UPI00191AAFEB|nr:type II toxin-antitoxin system VapC family toxin [Psychrobacter sp. 72-O-c]
MDIEIAKLLDSNFLTYLLEGKNIDENDANLIERLTDLLALVNDDNVELVITPLLRYEFLRKFGWQTESEDFVKLKAAVEEFTWLDISKDVTDLATNLYRLDKYESENKGISKNLEKRKLDVFHFATAKINGIELLSNDKHIGQIEELYNRYQAL